jgi:ParB family chromosome partitioning protein
MPKPPSDPTAAPPAGTGKKRVLGKGLSALIPDMTPEGLKSADFFLCDIDRIRPNRYQPRVRFNEDELAELARSIGANGILQPLLVRREGPAFELIAGERRLRAAKLAGLAQVPVLIREIDAPDLLQISIIENIQREDLNPMEEADAYHQLMTLFELTQEQVAERVGKSRSAVANVLRLRQLPEPVKGHIRDGRLTSGHGRALLGARTPALLTKAWRTVMAGGLSVRETERLVRRINRTETPQKPKVNSEAIYYTGISENLSRHFGTKVNIKRRGQRGRVEVEFYTNEDLERILGMLKAV